MTPWTCAPLPGWPRSTHVQLSLTPLLLLLFLRCSFSIALWQSHQPPNLLAHPSTRLLAFSRRKKIWNPLLLLAAPRPARFRLIFFNMTTRKLGREEIDWNWILLIKWTDGGNRPFTQLNSMRRVFNVSRKRTFVCCQCCDYSIKIILLISPE